MISHLTQKRYLPIIIYTSVSIIVLGRLLFPGFVLTLDMVFSPNGTDINVSDWFYGLDTQVFGGLPFSLLLKGLASIIPMWIIQKVILFLILFLSGFSAHWFCQSKNQTGKYFAGLLYMLNPFVYVRFMAGHWLLLLGYAVAPFAIKAMVSFIDEQTLKNTIVMTLLITLVAVFSSHMVILVLFVFVVILSVGFVRHRGEPGKRMKTAKGVGLASAVFFVLNVFWIWPILTSHSILSEITREDLYAFTAKSWGTGPTVLFSIASMHGFWRGGYRYISDIVPFWYVIYGLILFVTVYGFIRRFRDKHIGLLVIALTVVAVLALALGTGVSTPYFSGFFEFLFNRIFFFRGFRDSQKFVALLALSYSYLGGIGVGELFLAIRRKKKAFANAFIVFVLVAVPVYSINMLDGFNGQLRSTWYPFEWTEVNKFLDAQEGDFNVLFLPWHWYMTFSWSDDRIMNPAESFFDRKIIQGKNIEIGTIETQSPRPEQRYIGFLMEHRNQIENLGMFIAPLNIKYVLLAKEADFKEYGFVDKQKDLKLVFENSRLSVYENLHPIAAVYHTDNIRQIKDWEELLEAFKSGGSDTMDFAILMNNHSNVVTPSTFYPLRYSRISPIKYEVQCPEKGFIILSVPYDEGWELDAAGSLPNLGVTNAFYVPGSGSYTVSYGRFRVLLVAYLLSAISFSFTIIMLAFSGTRTERRKERHLT